MYLLLLCSLLLFSATLVHWKKPVLHRPDVSAQASWQILLLFLFWSTLGFTAQRGPMTEVHVQTAFEFEHAQYPIKCGHMPLWDTVQSLFSTSLCTFAWWEERDRNDQIIEHWNGSIWWKASFIMHTILELIKNLITHFVAEILVSLENGTN